MRMTQQNVKIKITGCFWVYDGVLKPPNYVAEVVVRDEVKCIPEQAFNNKSELRWIEIPNSVQEIDKYAFYECTLLEYINLPPSIVLIDKSAFHSCHSLKSIDLPNIECIEPFVFHSCTSLTSIHLPSSIKHINRFAFHDCKSLSHIDFPPSVVSIGRLAFGGCDSLQSIKFQSSETYLHESAFKSTPKLESLMLPSSNKFIHPSIFNLLRTIVRNYPKTARKPCISDESVLPLHLHLMHGYVHYRKNGIDQLIQAAPMVLSARDPMYLMYPFLLAACVPLNQVKRVNGFQYDEVEHLETIYVTLREEPGLMVSLISGNLTRYQKLKEAIKRFSCHH